jgi:hypothetical protein
VARLDDWISTPTTLYSWSNEPEYREIAESKRPFQMVMSMDEDLNIFIRIYESELGKFDKLVSMEGIYCGD